MNPEVGLEPTTVGSEMLNKHSETNLSRRIEF